MNSKLKNVTDDDLLRELRTRNYALSVWSRFDVLYQAIEHGIMLTEDEIKKLIERLDSKHDATIGINWDVIDAWIDIVVDDRPDEEIQGIECDVRYHDDGTEFTTIIHFDHGEPRDNIRYTDDQVFFYCNGPANVAAMMDENSEQEFMVTKVHELIYSEPNAHDHE